MMYLVSTIENHTIKTGFQFKEATSMQYKCTITTLASSSARCTSDFNCNDHNKKQEVKGNK
jgi:hypothetical protein